MQAGREGGTEGRAGRKEEWEAKEEKADREKQREGDRKVRERERGRERTERKERETMCLLTVFVVDVELCEPVLCVGSLLDDLPHMPRVV